MTPPHPPAPGVRSLVAYDVVADPGVAARVPHRGLPTFGLTLVVPLDAPLHVAGDEGAWSRRSGEVHAVCVGGLHTSPVYLDRPDRQVGVQVSLHPLAARRLLGLPAAELTAPSQEGADVVGARAEVLRRALLAAPAHRRGAVVAEALRRWWTDADRAAPPRREVVGACQIVERTRGRISVDALAREVAVTPRHLSTLIRTELGVGPKRLADLVRFETAHRELDRRVRAGSPIDLAGLAHDHGYADHSHLVRAYHRFAGSSPVDWIADERTPHRDGPRPRRDARSLPKRPSAGPASASTVEP